MGSQSPTKYSNPRRPYLLVLLILLLALLLNLCFLKGNQPEIPQQAPSTPRIQSRRTVIDLAGLPEELISNKMAMTIFDQSPLEHTSFSDDGKPIRSPESGSMDDPDAGVPQTTPQLETRTGLRPESGRTPDPSTPAGIEVDANERKGLDVDKKSWQVEGRLGQLVSSSSGVYLDRTFTVFDTTLELFGRKEATSFGMRWRGRYVPGKDFAGNIPSNFLEEARYRWDKFAGSYRLTLGRHYIDSIASELLDGVSVEKSFDPGNGYGTFFGFRPDPYDFRFRSDAFSTGLFSSWRGNSGSSYSRQAVVLNYLKTGVDRAYFSWDAGLPLHEKVNLRQFVVVDVNPKDGGLTFTNYALNLDAKPNRDLWIGWSGKVYRNIRFAESKVYQNFQFAENPVSISIDTSPIYTSSLDLRYVFSPFLIGRARAEGAHRNLDGANSFSWTLGADFPNLYRSGTNVGVLYSNTHYYNAFFDSYNATLSRAFGQRWFLVSGLKYWRNISDQPQSRPTTRYHAIFASGTYQATDRLDISAYFNYQDSRYGNGPTLGFGFDRKPSLIGTLDRSLGRNASLILQYRF